MKFQFIYLGSIIISLTILLYCHLNYIPLTIFMTLIKAFVAYEINMELKKENKKKQLFFFNVSCHSNRLTKAYSKENNLINN